MSNLTLQKIAYFCHGWFLVAQGRPLSKHSFEAWQFGPVLQSIYRDFKSFDRSPITARCTALDPLTGERNIVPSIADADAIEVVRQCVSFYGRLRAGTLVEMSHDPGGPWDRSWNSSSEINPGMKIDDLVIRDYFAGMTRPF
ncbi:type II toxin-antitoxin system antitoxin SocA domain-containing protein [Xanthomonas euroxanthea]|uniref:type II toxin-antitoxin system antitoxin SocA domain-containing protein n=1 Tax=Xanthomonas euroxanthea TaxID=2259622 RepID=UPI00160D7C8D|nr:type II toxin-antitoxin system antitoxin SocA domain-containing protein [Xanthomonas euroxanthea]MBB5766714.1 putative phage-associated protein [Xanthomonas euroxanthea]